MNGRHLNEIETLGTPGVFLMTDSLQVGGTERQFSALAKTLDSRKYSVALGCLQRKGPFLEGLGDISEFNLGGSFFGVRAQRARFALARQLRAGDIAVAHAFDFYSNLMLIPTAKLSGVPVVIGSQRQLGDLLTPMQSWAQGVAFRVCDMVVCNSRAAAARLIARGLPARKVTVIANGLPKEAFAQTPPSLPRAAETTRVALIARMNDPVKNHAGFLRAAARVASKYAGVEFLLIGDGPLRPDLEALAENLGVRGRMRFLGERKDIAGLLAATDISVICSSSESMSNAALESMAGGVAVIASRVGGNIEIVQNMQTGVLMEPRSDEELARALETLIRDPTLRTKLAQQAREFALANFSAEKIAKEYEDLYAGLLAEKNWRRHRTIARPEIAAGTSRRIRVAIVAASLRWIGGQSAQADQLMSNWKDDPAVDARFVAVDPELPGLLRWIERIPYLRTVVRMPFYLAALSNVTKQVDLVHIFSASYWSFLVAPLPAWLMARLRKKKVVVHYHSGEAGDHLRHSRLAVKVLREADRLVVPSQYLVDVFREFDLHTQAVPNVPDLSQFAFAPRMPLRPLMVNTRGFHRYYGIDAVVQAFTHVQQQFPESRLCLVGQGPLEKEIRRLTAKLNGIDFAGPVSRQKIGGFYSRNHVFLNASWLDNAPVSVLEAFASGTPVVTTAPDGIRYMVEHERTGLLCAPGDWRGLGENVIRLLRDQMLAARIAQNAYEESQRYRWELVRALWLEMYRSMCALKNGDGITPRQFSSLILHADENNPIEKELPERSAVVGSIK